MFDCGVLWVMIDDGGRCMVYVGDDGDGYGDDGAWCWTIIGDDGW